MKHCLRCIHNFNGFHLLTDCFSFWFILNILCIEQTMLGAHSTTLTNSSRVWHGMDQTIIDSATDEWHGRVRACVQAKGGHFEQML